MSNSIANRLDKALKRIGTVRTARMQRITISGGDQFLGRPGTPTTTPIPFATQPVGYYAGVKAAELSVGSRVVRADDYILQCSANQITYDQVTDPQIQIVLTDQLSREETYQIYDYDGSDYQGQYVAFTLYLRSVKRA